MTAVDDVARCLIKDTPNKPRSWTIVMTPTGSEPLPPRALFSNIPNMIKEVGIQRRADVTIENVKKLIMRAIEEYRNDSDASER